MRRAQAVFETWHTNGRRRLLSRGSLSSGFFPGLPGKTGEEAIWRIGISRSEMQISADMERSGPAGLEAWGRNQYAVVFLFLRELLLSLNTESVIHQISRRSWDSLVFSL